MQYTKIIFLVLMALTFVGNIQGQSKKEVAERLASLEKKISGADANNKLLLDSIAQLEDKVKEMDSNIQMLNDKIGQLAVMVENLSEEVKKANKTAEDQGGGVDQIPENHTSIEFEQDTFDFGEIVEGKAITHFYVFKNTGEKPLKIESARGSCGCTVPEWPKGEIAPGATGKLKVVFNSKGKRGPQDKIVTVLANTNPTKSIVYIKGVVKSEE